MEIKNKFGFDFNYEKLIDIILALFPESIQDFIYASTLKCLLKVSAELLLKYVSIYHTDHCEVTGCLRQGEMLLKRGFVAEWDFMVELCGREVLCFLLMRE